MSYLNGLCLKDFSCHTYLMNLEEILILEHISDTSADGSFLPCSESVLGVLYGSIKLLAG